MSPYTEPFNFEHINSDNKMREINRKLFLGLLIEGGKGIEAIDNICSKLNKHISLIYFGLYDFSSSMGLKPHGVTQNNPSSKKKLQKLARNTILKLDQ